jgi:hypothetical protein
MDDCLRELKILSFEFSYVVLCLQANVLLDDMMMEVVAGHAISARTRQLKMPLRCANLALIILPRKQQVPNSLKIVLFVSTVLDFSTSYKVMLFGSALWAWYLFVGVCMRTMCCRLLQLTRRAGGLYGLPRWLRNRN